MNSFLKARQFFVAFCFFGAPFSHKKHSTAHLIFATEVDNLSLLPPKSTLRFPIITTMKDMKEKNLIKTRISVGSVLKAKVGEMDDNTREVRSRKK